MNTDRKMQIFGSVVIIEPGANVRGKTTKPGYPEKEPGFRVTRLQSVLIIVGISE